MPPPSQYQARRLLELVSHNKTRIAERDHVDQDVWARSNPPVRGLNFRDRATATCCLRAGGLGAVPVTPAELPDVQSPRLLPLLSNQQTIPRIESNQSKLTISSVPSFGKMRDPLPMESPALISHPTRPTPITEYQEFGSEALITQVQDEIDEEFDDSSAGKLFSDIGPSVSIAKGIDGKRPKQTTHPPEPREMRVNYPVVEPVSQGRDDIESDQQSLSSSSKSFTSAPKTSTSMPSSSMPSTTATVPAPPMPPLPAYALEPENQSENKTYQAQFQPESLPIPPPPPPPLYTVQSYGSTSAVPPPPLSPPPAADDKHHQRDTEDSSPVSDGESYDYKDQAGDEFSDLADNSVSLVKTPWYREYAPTGSTIVDKEEKEEVQEEDEVESFEVEEVESVEEEEYEQGVGVRVDRDLVGRRREGLVG